MTITLYIDGHFAKARTFNDIYTRREIIKGWMKDIEPLRNKHEFYMEVTEIELKPSKKD